MDYIFAENLRKLREKSGLSQKQLGKQMFVNPSTIANWESGRRLPDAVMILRLAKCLGVDASTLLQLVAQSEKCPNVIMVDDSEIILTGGMSVPERFPEPAFPVLYMHRFHLYPGKPLDTALLHTCP